MSAAPRVSVAVPLYNEADVFPAFLYRVRATLDALPGGPHEIVFVDDGSSDATFALVEIAAATDARIVGLSLSRNFGHQAALSAALGASTGDVVVLMDGDLQDRPEEIPRFLEEYAKGFDVVYAQRTGREEGVILRCCYFVFYRLIAALADVRLPLDAGDFSLMSRRVVDRVVAMPERDRYLRGLRTWVGFSQTGVPVKRDPRASGTSSYSFSKLLRLAFDGIFSFSVAPLRAATIMGLIATTSAVCFSAYALYARVFGGASPRGFTALIVAITFFSGTQLIFLGIIGEYLGRLYGEAKGRPEFIVARSVGQRSDGR